MTIDEAIEDLTSMKKVLKSLLPLGEQEALSLGIEALKRIDHLRAKGWAVLEHLLPGETKD